MRRHAFIALAISFAVLAAGLILFYWTSLPTTLRVAVGPLGSEDTRLVAAMAQHLAREKHTVRLKLVLTDGVAGSAKAIEDETAHLAVVRTDVAMPSKAQTVAILHRDVALLLALPGAGIAQVSDLEGRNVGVVRDVPANRDLLQTLLAQYEIPKDSVNMVMLGSANEIAEAFASRRIDAALVVGTVTGRTVTEAVAAAAQAASGPPVFIRVGEADAIEQRMPAFETLEVVRGTFGGTPPRPAETFETLGVSHRLVALTTLDEGIVSELTRLIFAMRPALSNEAPIANRIESPEISKGSSLPVHPGASAYYEGEVQTFFERYGDWFYLAVMALSILGSGAAAMASSAAGRSRARNMALLSELLSIVRTAHAVDSEAELDRLERNADEILAAALVKAGHGDIDNAGVAAFTLGLDQARRAIAERRQILMNRPPLSRAAE
jgi:TRAP transporter TAXI family solute receptor